METIIETPILTAKDTVVEVFKTNVNDADQASSVKMTLLNAFPTSKINFDLQDCDKILRIEGKCIHQETVMDIVTSRGYICEVLM